MMYPFHGKVAVSWLFGRIDGIPKFALRGAPSLVSPVEVGFLAYNMAACSVRSSLNQVLASISIVVK